MGFLRLGSGGGLVIALVFNIVALSTPSWRTTPTGSIGLFKVKLNTGQTQKIVEKGHAENVAIAFNILSDIMLLCAAGLILIAERDESKQQFGMIGGGVGIAAAIFIMIGMATYTGIYKPYIDPFPNQNWGYSFALGWTAFCIALIGGVAAVAGK